jgi:hypothetical protein
VRAKAVTTATHKLGRLIYAMLGMGEDFTDWGQGQLWEGCRQRVFYKLAQRAKAMGIQPWSNQNTA